MISPFELTDRGAYLIAMRGLDIEQANRRLRYWNAWLRWRKLEVEAAKLAKVRKARAAK